MAPASPGLVHRVCRSRASVTSRHRAQDAAERPSCAPRRGALSAQDGEHDALHELTCSRGARGRSPLGARRLRRLVAKAVRRRRLRAVQGRRVEHQPRRAPPTQALTSTTPPGQRNTVVRHDDEPGSASPSAVSHAIQRWPGTARRCPPRIAGQAFGASSGGRAANKRRSSRPPPIAATAPDALRPRGRCSRRRFPASNSSPASLTALATVPHLHDAVGSKARAPAGEPRQHACAARPRISRARAATVAPSRRSAAAPAGRAAATPHPGFGKARARSGESVTSG